MTRLPRSHQPWVLPPERLAPEGASLTDPAARIWILGAPDPEMQEIERVLCAAGEQVAHATHRGERCHPGNAYRADGLDLAAAYSIVCLVECDLPGWWSGDPAPIVRRIDHHREGDPGFGRPPARYLSASSLGQVLAELRHEATPEQRVIAAADHCLAAAYQGRCPGVNPEDLATWRAESRAKFQHRPVEAVLADVEVARKMLRSASWKHCTCFQEDPEHRQDCRWCGGVGRIDLPFADLRGESVPELPEAAAQEGIPFVSALDERGRKKVVLQAAPPELVRQFLAGELRDAGGSPISHSLTDMYGDPARGFAGGYVATT